MSSESELDGLVPDRLQPRSAKISLDALEVSVDIGFHEHEVGTPQRLLVTVEIWLDHVPPAGVDDPASAWDYDIVRELVENLAKSNRYNLQETFAHAVYERIAALHSVRALRVVTAKPDSYPNVRAVEFALSSFNGLEP